MRIVSQERKWSTDFNNTVFWMQDNIICAKIDGVSVVFGEYESCERAQEVFLDIHNAYAPVGIVATNLSEEQCCQFIGSESVKMNIVQMPAGFNSEIVMYEAYVYYMPIE